MVTVSRNFTGRVRERKKEREAGVGGDSTDYDSIPQGWLRENLQVCLKKSSFGWEERGKKGSMCLPVLCHSVALCVVRAFIWFGQHVDKRHFFFFSKDMVRYFKSMFFTLYNNSEWMNFLTPTIEMSPPLLPPMWSFVWIQLHTPKKVARLFFSEWHLFLVWH